MEIRGMYLWCRTSVAVSEVFLSFFLVPPEEKIIEEGLQQSKSFFFFLTGWHFAALC